LLQFVISKLPWDTTDFMSVVVQFQPTDNDNTLPARFGRAEGGLTNIN
jgi:hypothetical protein